MLARIGQLPGSWRVRHDRTPASLAKVLYEQARELALQDPSPVRIARQLSASHSVNLSPGTIGHWIIGDRKPRGRNVLVEGSSPAPSYVIGAIIGDGSTLVRRGLVKLSVADRDFAEAFNASMMTLFSRDNPNTILVQYSPDRLPMYTVKYSCRQLVDLLRQSRKGPPELASAFPRGFLRGFFDAEGHVDVPARGAFLVNVGAENSDRVLLSRVRLLLLRVFGIESKIYRKRRPGSLKIIRGTPFRMRRTSYSLLIMRFLSARAFHHAIGFSILRKNQKLEDSVIIQKYGRKSASAVWKRLYIKRNGEWVRRSVIPNQRY